MSKHQHANPEYIGPGTWSVLHTIAFNARTPAEQKACIKQIKIICQQFPCEKCREHAIMYLKAHPLTVGTSDSLFEWTWKFHNAVNLRIGKYQMQWDMAYYIYESLHDQKHQECSTECSLSE
jgi:hypothetical protein